MKATARPNAIETRLFALYEQCKAFLENPEARLLCWRIRSDEAPLLKTFVAIESDEQGDLPALFLRCDAPFQSAHQYTNALITSLEESCRESREEMGSAGLSEWSAQPTPSQLNPMQLNPASRWVYQLKDFVRHHQSLFPTAVAVLEPPSIANPTDFQDWVQKVTELCPTEVRLIVLELIEAPLISGLQERLQGRLMRVEANLNMPAAVQQLSQNLPDRAASSGLFRQHFIALTQAAGAGALSKVKTEANAAITITRKEAWYSLEVAVFCAQGAAFQAVAVGQKGGEAGKLFSEAMSSYQHALQASHALSTVDPVLGLQLQLKVQLSIAGVWVAQGQFASAAAVYEACAAIAMETQEPILQLESWRMASWCLEQTRDTRNAWRCGQRGLEVAQSLDESTRQKSTLPYLGQGLLRLCARGEYAGHRRALEQRFEQLLGTADWLPPSQSVTPIGSGGAA